MRKKGACDCNLRFFRGQFTAQHPRCRRIYVYYSDVVEGGARRQFAKEAKEAKAPRYEQAAGLDAESGQDISKGAACMAMN